MLIKVKCKLCGLKYSVPNEVQDFKCSCIDKYPSAFDPGVPPCNCIEMPGDIICVPGCQQIQYLEDAKAKFHIRAVERTIFREP